MAAEPPPLASPHRPPPCCSLAVGQDLLASAVVFAAGTMFTMPSCMAPASFCPSALGTMHSCTLGRLIVLAPLLGGLVMGRPAASKEVPELACAAARLTRAPTLGCLAALEAALVPTAEVAGPLCDDLGRFRSFSCLACWPIAIKRRISAKVSRSTELPRAPELDGNDDEDDEDGDEDDAKDGTGTSAAVEAIMISTACLGDMRAEAMTAACRGRHRLAPYLEAELWVYSDSAGALDAWG